MLGSKHVVEDSALFGGVRLRALLHLYWEYVDAYGDIDVRMVCCCIVVDVVLLHTSIPCL